MEHSFKIDERDLVAAFVADILWSIGGYIHLLSADAVGNAGKEMNRPFCQALPFAALRIEDGIALLPELHGNDRLHLMEHPLALWLKLPGLIALRLVAVVRAAETFGCGVAEKAIDGSIRKQGAFTHPVS